MNLLQSNAPWSDEVYQCLHTELIDLCSSYVLKPSLLDQLKSALKQLKNGKFLSAYLDLGEITRRYRWSSALHYCSGYAAMKLQHRELALSHYAQALSHDQIAVFASLEIMNCLYHQNDHSGLEAFIHSQLIRRDLSEYHYALGLVEHQRRAFTRSEEFFKHALKRTSLEARNYVIYQIALIQSLYMQTRYEDALEILRDAVLVHQKEPNLWLLMAKCLFRLQSPSEGSIALKRALKIAPQSIQVYMTYTDELTISEPRIAIKYALKALRYGDSSPRLYLKLIDLYEQQGSYSEALYYLHQYKKLYESSHPYHLKAQVRIRHLETQLQANPLSWYRRWIQRARAPR